jgi:hypothetical protein
MKKILIAILTLTLILGLCSCSSGGNTNKSNELVGKWSGNDYVYEFFSDGTVTKDAVGSYHFWTYDYAVLDDSNIRFSGCDNHNFNGVYEYSIQGNKLSLKEKDDSTPSTYTKVK